jgi:UDP-2,3-diacylglucosamine pyrophosphatase LpxH
MNNYIISDIHFSKTKVLKSISDPMDEFISILRADDEDKRVIISGDYFDQHFDNSDLAYKVAAQYLKNICDLALETIILYGTKSHDRSNYEPILPFLNENVHFFDKVGAFTSKIDNTKFLLIPEEYPEDFSDYYSDHIMADENAYDVVIGHGNIVGAKMNEYVKIDNNKLGGRAFNKEDLGKIAKEVFFGHIHLRQNLLDNVQYVGSMNKTGFGEMEEKKGFWKFNTFEGTKEFFALGSVHEYKDIPYKDKDSIDMENKHLFRVVVDNEVDEETLDFIKKNKLKVKNVDKTARQDKELKAESKLKYENLDESASIKEQLNIALESDTRSSKELKKVISAEIQSYLS